MAKKIILADNDKKVLRTLSEVLRETGYQVTEARSVSEARKKLQEGGSDLAIIDLHLETDDKEDDLSGLELAETLGTSIPVIMLTGLPTTKAARRVRQKRRRTAVRAIVSKDDGPEVLLEEVRKEFVPKVFLAHGHDREARKTVREFLEKGGLEVVVLQERLTIGLSILEKFEEHSKVDFAIVLVTPDDVGSKRDPLELRPRARQNVVFELGFFLAKLGRNKVVALCKEDQGNIEFPSNYEGVQRLHMDLEGGWRKILAQEMRRVLKR
jgi:CheY-like chemotaxis protein/vacuolar-type H+-ATPase subunit F/Vma7